MSDLQNQINCIAAQLRAERETRQLLNDMPFHSTLSESRKEQIVEQRKAQERRRFGLTLDDNIRI